MIEQLGATRTPTHTPHLEEFEQGDFVYVVDTELGHLQDQERDIHQVLGNLLLKHIETDNSVIGLLEYDREAHPAQRLDVVEVRAKDPSSLVSLEELATAVYPEYPELKSQYLLPEDAKMFSLIAEDFNEGRDYVFLFDHSRIDSIAFGTVATLGAIANGATILGKEMPHFNKRITVSKILSRATALGLPVTDVLAGLGIVDLSMPPSESMKASSITDGFRETINTSLLAARMAIDHADPRVPTADFISGSGATDILVPRSFGRKRRARGVHMGPMSRGTAEMLGSARVLDASVNVSKVRPTSAIGVVRNPPKDMAEAHDIMFHLAKLAKESTGKTHFYHPTRENFSNAVRGTRKY